MQVLTQERLIPGKTALLSLCSKANSSLERISPPLGPLNEADMDVIAECMALIAADPEGNNEAVKAKVKALTDKYPLYA